MHAKREGEDETSIINCFLLLSLKRTISNQEKWDCIGEVSLVGHIISDCYPPVSNTV